MNQHRVCFGSVALGSCVAGGNGEPLSSVYWGVGQEGVEKHRLGKTDWEGQAGLVLVLVLL